MSTEQFCPRPEELPGFSRLFLVTVFKTWSRLTYCMRHATMGMDLSHISNIYSYHKNRSDLSHFLQWICVDKNFYGNELDGLQKNFWNFEYAFNSIHWAWAYAVKFNNLIEMRIRYHYYNNMQSLIYPIWIFKWKPLPKKKKFWQFPKRKWLSFNSIKK